VVKFRKSLRSLAGKLILTVGILMSVGSILFAYVLIQYQEQGMMENLTNYARFSANHIKSGIQYGMLTAQPDVIQRTVEVIRSVEEVLDIKIAKPDGTIAYASDTSDVGKKMALNLKTVEAMANAPQFIKGEGGKKVLELSTPIYNQPSCYTASCHFHPKDQKVLGVLFTRFSASKIESESRQHLLGMLGIGAISVGLFSVFLCVILYHFVSKPVALLEMGMKRLGKGDFDQPIEITTRDEMGLLAQTFNSMAQDIKRYRENMENWTKALQEEVDKKTAEIMKAQEQLIDAEKLASLGRMAAGIAHELNSPLTGIVTFAHLMRKRVEKENRSQDTEDLDVIIEQANRCSKIIKGLLGFARKGAHEKIQINVNALLDGTLAMVRNQAKFHNIQLKIDLPETIPAVVADPNQLQQVFLNMLTNAVDAMNDVGIISIATRRISNNSKGFIEIEFTDTGPGIPPENISKIFEPFFTTKAVGKGTGLGLPISYGIVKRLGGDITVQSEVGKGTTFTIRLPAEGPE
jgi:two-component system NtrC family sensor kinase